MNSERGTSNAKPGTRTPAVRSVLTSTHGRVLTQDAADALSPRLLVVFHGYAQSAEIALADAAAIPGVAEHWHVVAIQALHRFYAKDERVVASWMTRQDRDEAIADNVAYVDRVVAGEIARRVNRGPVRTSDRHPLVFLGFSQGASMAYRAALLGQHPAAGVVALGGDIPPEVRDAGEAARQPWPSVLIGAGTHDAWFAGRLGEDAAFLQSRRIPHEVCRFDGGHEWTGEFRSMVGRWLDALA
jgi:predicted esterase